MVSPNKWLDDAISDGKIHKIPFEEITKRETIGIGSFGTVYLADCKSITEKIVLKKVKKCHIKEKDSFFAFIKELKIHSNLEHANIIPLYGISEKQNSYYLAIQFANNGTLREFLKEKRHNEVALMLEIRSGLRETLFSDTPYEYMKLYEHCWISEPENRPLIQEVCSRLESIRMVLF
ncbi:2144_t:CDS:2 [Ambispora leptoticha]|uniref:2144_t:CDS:1 n=1 Tax=Ambispora leptoticha TaxID=144679 RepID=A0A9N8WE69_9GLOM|nr:2144_t:CDS:2 [Ambispora leptoticha]